jgi:hypothetical protein
MGAKIKFQLGTVRWFDDLTGRGIITADDGKEHTVIISLLDERGESSGTHSYGSDQSDL